VLHPEQIDKMRELGAVAVLPDRAHSLVEQPFATAFLVPSAPAHTPAFHRPTSTSRFTFSGTT
jgi:hypothetical protein